MDETHLLSISLPLVSAIFSATFFYLWIKQKKQRYILNWSLAFACGLVGATAGLARIFLIEAAWFSFIGNGFLAGMAYFACRGVMLRHTSHSSIHLLPPVLAITLLAGFWFGFVDPSIFARGAATSLGAAAMIFITASAILRADNRDMLGILTAITFFIASALLAGRPMVIYLLEGTVSHESEVINSWWGVSFRFLGMIIFVCVAILFLHRIATDLLNEFKGQAQTDYLTGVLNRGGFYSQVTSGKPHEPFAVIICDIDGFKDVNDNYGHHVGDRVIQNLAEVLSDAARPLGYIVGRFGGDEFVIMLPGANATEADAFAVRVRESFAARSHRGIPDSINVTISVGVAVASGVESLDVAIEHADASLYCAKKKGKDRTEIKAIPIMT